MASLAAPAADVKDSGFANSGGNQKLQNCCCCWRQHGANIKIDNRESLTTLCGRRGEFSTAHHVCSTKQYGHVNMWVKAKHNRKLSLHGLFVIKKSRFANRQAITNMGLGTNEISANIWLWCTLVVRYNLADFFAFTNKESLQFLKLRAWKNTNDSIQDDEPHDWRRHARVSVALTQFDNLGQSWVKMPHQLRKLPIKNKCCQPPDCVTKLGVDAIIVCFFDWDKRCVPNGSEKNYKMTTAPAGLRWCIQHD